MAKECGRKEQETVINIKDSMLMTKNLDMVYSLGPLEMCTKEIINRM